jgi:hypothetical protein
MIGIETISHEFADISIKAIKGRGKPDVGLIFKLLRIEEGFFNQIQ